MRKIAYLFIVIVAMSCNSICQLENLSVYKCERVGEIAPSYLIIKGGALKQCDLVSPSLGYGTLGNYLVKQDTLIFYAQYDYSSNSISVTDSIPNVFIMKDDCLLHIMNDSIWGKHENLYRRIK